MYRPHIVELYIATKKYKEFISFKTLKHRSVPLMERTIDLLLSTFMILLTLSFETIWKDMKASQYPASVPKIDMHLQVL